MNTEACLCIPPFSSNLSLCHYTLYSQKFVHDFYRYRFLVMCILRKEILVMNIKFYLETVIVVGADELVLKGRYIHLFIFHFCMLILVDYGLVRHVHKILKSNSY